MVLQTDKMFVVHKSAAEVTSSFLFWIWIHRIGGFPMFLVNAWEKARGRPLLAD
jgi:hypothetical protein